MKLFGQCGGVAKTEPSTKVIVSQCYTRWNALHDCVDRSETRFIVVGGSCYSMVVSFQNLAGSEEIVEYLHGYLQS